MNAEVMYTIDLNYVQGYVECQSCNWKHYLGNGFNGYVIKSCPTCDNSITTRNQRKVIYWDASIKSLRADIGTNMYFVLSNGIHIRYAKSNLFTVYGTERYLDRQ